MNYWYDEITSLAEENVGNWLKNPIFRWHVGRLDTEFDHEKCVLIPYETITGACNTKKSALDRANEESILEALNEYITADKPTVEEYAIRGENVLIVTALDSNGDETPAWRAIVDIARSLSDYPVLNEDLLSQYEMEENDAATERVIEQNFEKDEFDLGVSEYISEHGADNYCESSAVQRGLEHWYDAIDDSMKKQLIEIIKAENPELLSDTLKRPVGVAK